MESWESNSQQVLARSVAGFALMASLLVLAAMSNAGTTTKTEKLSDGSGAFATGHYRDLFAELGHSQAEISAKINAAFQQLFHGDPEEQSVYFYAGKNEHGPLAYITDWNNHDVRTEGM